MLSHTCILERGELLLSYLNTLCYFSLCVDDVLELKISTGFSSPKDHKQLNGEYIYVLYI